MNQISSALAQAGVKLPSLMRRVWQVLHDSKMPRSATCVANILHEPRNSVASAVNSMHSRGMVALARHELTRVKGPHNSTKNRLIAQWAAVGQEYELLPVSPTTKAEPIAKADVEQRFFRPAPPWAAEQFELDIEKMTLAQAHTLYKRLREFFA